MSETDREKWETRYREGAYAALSHPSVYLVRTLPFLTVPALKALDTINWHQLDLDRPMPAHLQGYGLIVMVRYLDITLLRSSFSRLLAGGYPG